MKGITRPARPEDAEGIARVCSAGWRDTLQRHQGARAHRGDHRRVLHRIRREIAELEGWDGWIAAVEDDTVVGAGGGGMVGSGVGEIFVLYLEPARRGEGIGTLLLEAITEQQRVRGAREQWGERRAGQTPRGFPSTTRAASICAGSDPSRARQ